VQSDECDALFLMMFEHPANKAMAVRAGAVDLAEAACARFVVGTDSHEVAARLLEALRRPLEPAARGQNSCTSSK
jgi:hypothetical protein